MYIFYINTYMISLYIFIFSYYTFTYIYCYHIKIKIIYYSSLFISVYSSVDGQSVGLVGTFGHSWGTDTGLPGKLSMPPR